MADPDWTDPCAVAAWLKPQLYKVAAGQGTVQVRHGDNFVEYGAANLQTLQSLYLQASSDCAKKTGAPGRRRAFVAR